MNTESSSSTPQDSSNAGSEITAQPRPPVGDIASMASATRQGKNDATPVTGEAQRAPQPSAAEPLPAPQAEAPQSGLPDSPPCAPAPGIPHFTAVDLAVGSPVIGAEPVVHHLKATPNYLAPPEPIPPHDKPEVERARVVLKRLHPPDGVVPATVATGTLLRDFYNAWKDDPELEKQEPPSDSSIKRAAGRKK